MPPIGDIEFPSPAKWQEITKARTKSIATEREKAILKALDSPITVRFEGSTIEAVIDYLQTLSDLTIVAGQADAGSGRHQLRHADQPPEDAQLSLRTVLRKVLGEVGLTYIVEKETIHVLTTDEAKKKMTVRTYYLGDMAGVADVTLGPVFSRLQMARHGGQPDSDDRRHRRSGHLEGQQPRGEGTIIFDRGPSR